MIRVLLYLLLIVVVGSGFAWLDSYSGNIVITAQDRRITLSLLTAFCVFLAAVLCFVFCLRLIRAVICLPAVFERWRNRRHARAYEALLSGLIAVLAGDVVLAQRMMRQVNSRLSAHKEPLLLFLEAKIRQLDLDHEGAVRLFRKMQKNTRTRLLALKSLFDEAIENGDQESAIQYSSDAAALNPELGWANLTLLEKLSADGEWKGALELFDRLVCYRAKTAGTGGIDKKLMDYRVTLMTGLAQSLLKEYPDEACRLALKVHRLQPSFVPAASIVARVLFEQKKIRKGSKLVEAMWKVKPHPDLGAVYVNAAGQEESVSERLKRARQLAQVNPGNHESGMLVARTALEAGDLALARRQAEMVAITSPAESTFLLLADIERVQTGDSDKIRMWLSRAIQAKSDMAWIADDTIFPEWLPISPVTGRLAVCEWKAPAKSRKIFFNEHAHAPTRYISARENIRRQPLVPDGTTSAEDNLSGPLNIDVEPPFCHDQETVPSFVTRLVVDDPGVRDLSRR